MNFPHKSTLHTPQQSHKGPSFSCSVCNHHHLKCCHFLVSPTHSHGHSDTQEDAGGRNWHSQFTVINASLSGNTECVIIGLILCKNKHWPGPGINFSVGTQHLIIALSSKKLLCLTKYAIEWESRAQSSIHNSWCQNMSQSNKPVSNRYFCH